MKNGDGKTIKSMTFEELTDHIQGLFNEAHSLKRQAALVVVRAGEALSLAREKLPEGLTWVKFQEELGLPRATVNEAIRLHRAAKEVGLSEKELAGLGIMDAKYLLGIRLRRLVPEENPPYHLKRYNIPPVTKKNYLTAMGTALDALDKTLSFADDSDPEQLAELVRRLVNIERRAQKHLKRFAETVKG